VGVLLWRHSTPGRKHTWQDTHLWQVGVLDSEWVSLKPRLGGAAGSFTDPVNGRYSEYDCRKRRLPSYRPSVLICAAMDIGMKLHGPKLLLYTCGAMSLLFVVRLLAGGGFVEEGIRAVVRTTAQTSLIFFTAAFVASSLRALMPTPATRWLLVNRRFLGISMGFSHAVHLASLIALGTVSQSFIDGLNATTLIGGGLGFALCFAMTATSNNRAVAWLGASRWRALHKTGGYYLWFIFFQSYLGRALAVSPVYALPVALLAVTLVLRLTAWWQQRRPASAAVLAS